MNGIAALLDDARGRLDGAPVAHLGTVVSPKRVLGIARAPRLVPAGTAWHLGVLLLTEDALLATGEIVRARAEAVRGFTAESQRARSEIAAAAVRGGFPEGAAVHVGWRVLSLDPPESPLWITGGVPTVRWSRSSGPMPLAAYLAERIGLLLHPPKGAA